MRPSRNMTTLTETDPISIPIDGIFCSIGAIINNAKMRLASHFGMDPFVGHVLKPLLLSFERQYLYSRSNEKALYACTFTAIGRLGGLD